VSSILSPLSGLVSEDSEFARAALATFVALILDWTLRSEVVEGISWESVTDDLRVETETGGVEQEAEWFAGEETQTAAYCVCICLVQFTLAPVFVITFAAGPLTDGQCTCWP